MSLREGYHHVRASQVQVVVEEDAVAVVEKAECPPDHRR